MSINPAKLPDQKPKIVQPQLGRSKEKRNRLKSKEHTPSSECSSLFGHLQSISRNWYAKIFSQVESKEVIAGDKQGVLNSSTEEELRKIFHAHKEVFPESWVRADMPDAPHADYERVTLSQGIRVIEVPTVRMKLQPRLSSGISDPWRKYGPYLKLCEIGGTGVKRGEELIVYTIEKGAAPPPPPTRKPIMTADEVEARLKQRQLIQAQQQPQQQARQAPAENSQGCSENRKSNNGSPLAKGQDESGTNSRDKNRPENRKI